MIILAIETTSKLASVAIRDKLGNIHEEDSTEKLSHLQNLMPMIDALLMRCQLQLDDIDLISVSRGPGSFTGIRIGIATAKALAQFLAIKIISVPTLHAMAYGHEEYDGVLCPMIDARRGQVYGAAYRWEDSVEGRSCLEVLKPGPYMETEFRALLENARKGRELLFLGEESQRAINVAKLGFDLYNKGAETDFYQISPEYMRKSEAEQKLEEKTKTT